MTRNPPNIIPRQYFRLYSILKRKSESCSGCRVNVRIHVYIVHVVCTCVHVHVVCSISVCPFLLASVVTWLARGCVLWWLVRRCCLRSSTPALRPATSRPDSVSLTGRNRYECGIKSIVMIGVMGHIHVHVHVYIYMNMCTST